jgi:hypothetical protein
MTTLTGCAVPTLPFSFVLVMERGFRFHCLGGEREWIIIKEKLYHPGLACTLLAQTGHDCKRNVLVWKESPLEKRWCFLRVGVSPQDI